MCRLPLLFLLAAATIAATPGTAPAEVTVYVEDFEDGAGNPAFDPMFSHEITASPYAEPMLYRELRSLPSSPGTGIALFLAPAQDTVTFSLLPGQEIVYVSVDANIFSSGGTEKTSIDFIGRDDTFRVLLGSPCEWKTITASSSGIGPIQEIQMRSLEGYFDNITIHVIPEPSLVVMALAGMLICLTMINRRKVIF